MSCAVDAGPLDHRNIEIGLRSEGKHLTSSRFSVAYPTPPPPKTFGHSLYTPTRDPLAT